MAPSALLAPLCTWAPCCSTNCNWYLHGSKYGLAKRGGWGLGRTRDALLSLVVAGGRLLLTPVNSVRVTSQRHSAHKRIVLGQVAHDCTIIGEGGAYWPLPTFRVVAADRPTEPLTAKSCTGCWTQVRAAQLA